VQALIGGLGRSAMDLVTYTGEIGTLFARSVRGLFEPQARHRQIARQMVEIGISTLPVSGIIIFLSGERRYISRNTTLLLHLAGRRFDPSVRFTAHEIAAMAAEDSLKDLQYARVVAESSFSLSAEHVLAMMEKNTVLSPEELVTLGLAHALLS